MFSKRKILAFTATRSDYDLLSYLYKKLTMDPDLDFKLLVSGTHLSQTFGYSAQEITKDNISILAKIETLLDSDTKASRIKSASILMLNSIQFITEYNPDLIIYCGDREDALIAATLSTYLRIPGLHFFGGDHSTDGNIDNPVRHAISKLSTAHFVSIEQHKNRLVKLGESPHRIFQIGSLSVDKLVSEKKMTIRDLQFAFNIAQWPTQYAVLTFHAMPEFEQESGQHIQNIIECLLENNYTVFCNSPNIDAGGRNILSSIEKYKNNPSFISFKNIDRTTYVNLMRNASLFIGNSSGGIIEAASFHLKVINVGHRQMGRYNEGNVIFCGTSKNEINEALKKIENPDYLKLIQKLVNPYGLGNSSQLAYELIKKTDFNKLLKKEEDPLCL